MYWPVASRSDAAFAVSWDSARAWKAGCTAEATMPDVIRPRSFLVFILRSSLFLPVTAFSVRSSPSRWRGISRRGRRGQTTLRFRIGEPEGCVAEDLAFLGTLEVEAPPRGGDCTFSRIAAGGSGARIGSRAARAISGSGHVTAAQAELPDELVRSRAGDAHAAAMNSVQVVSGTEADQVLGVVAASLRARLDVVRVHRGPAAARDLAEVPVANADAARQRVRLLELCPPRVHEVLRQRHEAFSRPQPALRRRAGCAERGLDDLRDAHWHPDGKGPARAHLRLVLVLHGTTQRDAGHGLRLLDPALHLLSIRMPRDDARLLVADPLLAQRPPQQRDPIQAELERDSLRDGSLGHSQPLLAIVAEAGETERRAGAAALEHHRHVPEHLVPAGALLHQSLQLRVDAPGIDLPAELLRLERFDRREASPLAAFLFQQFLEGLEFVVGSEQHVVRALVGRRRMRAQVFLSPGVDPLLLRRRGTQDHSGDPQPFVELGPAFEQDLRAKVEPLLLV